jgi:hypothetical protein
MGMKAAELTNTPDKPATDEAILVAAIAFANGAPLTLHLDKKTLKATNAQRRELVRGLESGLDSPLGPLVQLVRGVKLSYGASLSDDGSSLRLNIQRDFKTVEAVLAMAVVLTMDKKHEFGSKVCRCKLQTCKAFFMAKQNPKGGPPNRTYCSPEHLAEHHNSVERRFPKE